MRRTVALVAGVVLGAGCAAVGAWAAPLSVVSASPRGQLSGGEQQRIQVVFSAAVVALGEAAESQTPPPWLTVTPPVPARWRWAGTAELVGEPLAPLPRATAYTVTIAGSVRAVDGSAPSGPFTFTFATPRPQADLSVRPEEDAPWTMRRAPRPDFPVVVEFDQPVDPASLLEHLSVRLAPRPLPGADAILDRAQAEALLASGGAAAEAWQAFLAASSPPEGTEEALYVLEPSPGPPATTTVGGGPPPAASPGAAAPASRFLVRPVGCWPPSRTVTVEITPGLTGLEGPLPSLTASRGSFPTAWPFAPTGFSGVRAGAAGLDPDRARLSFSAPVAWQQLAPYVRFRAAGEEAWRRPADASDRWYWDVPSTDVDLEPLGLTADRRWQVCVDAGVLDAFSRSLGFPWCGTLTTAHHTPVLYLVEGDGVVEWQGPHVIPLRLRNVTSVRTASRRVTEDELAGFLTERDTAFAALEPAPALPVTPPVDRTVLWPLRLDAALDGRPGVVASRIEVAGAVPGSEYGPEASQLRRPRTAITQVTSLGLTVKASGHEGTLVWVTRLADAAPAAGVSVTVRARDGSVLWRGVSDADGLARAPAGASLPDAFLVTASDGDDLAYARVQWWEGHRGWEFNLPVDMEPSAPMVGRVWTDRGVVRPGDTLHAKVVLRRQGDERLRLPGASTVVMVVRDSRGQDVGVHDLALDAWGAGDAEVAVPASAPLGHWEVLVGGGYDRTKRSFEGEPAWSVTGGFRVAEFRRPKFRVEVTAPAGPVVAGEPLHATVAGSLLAGGAMSGARVHWAARAVRAWWHPAGARWAGWSFVPDPWASDEENRERTVASGDGTLQADGTLALDLPALDAPGSWPSDLTVEAEVSDVDLQRQAARTGVRVLPGTFLLGLRSPDTFVAAAGGVTSALVALTSGGAVVPGVKATVELVRRHWESVRRREVSGRYVFESRPVSTSVTTTEVTTGGEPVEVHFGLEAGGEYALVARARDERGNELVASTSFYVFGTGFTPWRMDEGNRVDLVPERSRYAPGDTARILVKSPWEGAEALVTVERAGVLSARVVRLAGTMPVVEVPVVASFAPNVFVSVVVLRGRVGSTDAELVDPGRPAYRIGYCELEVPPAGRRLDVGVTTSQPAYRPGQTAEVRVAVRDEGGAGRRASVTVWAVDAGVLALTGYRTPDLMETFYARRGLGITTAESRSRLVGRRDYGTKGDASGGGGGREAAAGEVRRDFRALALWRADVVTGGDGTATVPFTLPDSLTTYRIMAVAVSGTEEFGSGDVEVLVSKPVGLEPALPRFLRPGDRARAAVVIRNRTAVERKVEVTVAVPADGPLRLRGGATRVASVPAGGSAEVGFGLVAAGPGEATVRFVAASPRPTLERDVMEVPLAVVPVALPERTATFLATGGRAEEAVAVPEDVFPDRGGLVVRAGGSPLLEAQPGLEWLLDYRHACAEQVAAQLLGVLAVADLPWPPVPSVGGVPRDAWLPGAVARLAACQRTDGGFAFWPDAGGSADALSAYAAWALAAAAGHGVTVDEGMLERARGYLSAMLRREVWPMGERYGWTVKVLAAFALGRLGHAEPAYFQALVDRRGEGPVWGRAVLAVAMLGADPGDPRVPSLLTEVRNGLSVESRTARLEEPAPEWGWCVWWDEPRGSAAALLALSAAGQGDPVADRLVRGLLDHLAHDSARTTHDTAWMLQALAAVWRGQVPSPGTGGGAEVSLGGERILVLEAGAGGPPWREAKVSLPELLRRASPPGRTVPVVVEAGGAGRVHASLELTTVPRTPPGRAVSRGLAVARAFLAADGRPVTRVAAGDEVDLEITVECPAGRRFLAVEVPLPAGLEAVDASLATSARVVGVAAGRDTSELDDGGWWPWRPGFDHVELRDDRVVLYASELPAGRHTHTVRCRATTAGTFLVAPARAEEMYAPEVFGATGTDRFEVTSR